jgi:sulfur carrier protein
MNTTAESITVLLDGEPRALPQGCTLAMLVASLQHAPTAVTTAVNGAFVPRGQREQHLLQEGDAVLLFQPIVGG